MNEEKVYTETAGREDKINLLVKENRDRREKDRQDSVQKLGDAFHSKLRDREFQNTDTEYPLYNAAAHYAELYKIRLVPLERLINASGDSFSLEDIARMSDFICREVELPAKWKKNDIGTVLIVRNGGRNPILCFRRLGQNVYWEQTMEKPVSVKKLPEQEDGESRTVYSLTQRLPAKPLSWKDMLKFTFRHLRITDFITLIIAGALASVASLQNSTLNSVLFGTVIPYGQMDLLGLLTLYILSWSMGGLIFEIAKSLGSFRMNSRAKYALQEALYDRLFHLKESYFRRKESAQISYRIEMLPNIYISLFSAAVDVILMLVFANIYISKMCTYSTQLTQIALNCVIITMVLTIVIGYMTQKLQRQRSQQTARMRSGLYQYFSMIQTIRTTGASDDVQNRYRKEYAQYGKLDIQSAAAARLTNLLVSITTCIATVLYFSRMGRGSLGISTSSFLAFLSAAGAFSGAMSSMAQDVLSFLIMWPILKDGSDVLQETPEDSLSGIVPEKLEGSIRLSRVSFRYGPKEPEILHNIDFEIIPGEYVGIVGASGCGKSTLLRLLLGFESVGSGKIYYDNIELERLNKVELRRKIGTVLQDGVLFSGSIEKNISIVCPGASHEDVEWAAEMADIKRDIDKMPLGYSTPVSEDSDTISGGQRQRILLARAILPHPSILLLDEATSALDNQSQDTVCRNLETLNCTRVVVAHRLSTVEKCDRIYVMNQGEIAECGTYRELMDKKGLFYQLVQRQQYDE